MTNGDACGSGSGGGPVMISAGIVHILLPRCCSTAEMATITIVRLAAVGEHILAKYRHRLFASQAGNMQYSTDW